MNRRTSVGVVGAAVVVAAGMAVGTSQGASSSGSPTHDATVDPAVDVVDLLPCPGAAPLGEVLGGEQLALTGRSVDGAWLQLQSPIEDDELVWVDAALVVTTEPVEDLPVARCGAVELAIALIGGADLTFSQKTTTTLAATTSTAPAGSSTTAPGDGEAPDTTAPGAAPGTPGPGPGTSPTTAPPPRPPRTTTTRPRPTTTTTTAPPDLDPPAISLFERSESSIFESGASGCQAPNQVYLSARITDASGLSNVRLIWRVTNPGRTATYVGGNVAMSRIEGTDVWRGQVGPVGQVVPNGVQAVVEWRVQAFDAAPARNVIIGDAPTNRWPAVLDC